MDDPLEGTKLQFEALMSEYRELESRKGNYRQMQSQLDSLALAALGISISLILVVLDRDPRNIGVILLFPVVFYAAAFTQLRYERIVLISAIYVDTELRPQIDGILSRLTLSDVHVLGHERFLSGRTWSLNILMEVISTASRALVSLAIAIGIALIFFYVKLAVQPVLAWNSYEVWLLVVNGLMLTVDLMIAFFIARTRHGYTTRYRSAGAHARVDRGARQPLKK